MCSAPNVIRSIILLYLLNSDLCHALDGSGDNGGITEDFSVESVSEEPVLPHSDSVKKILEKIKNSSDNKNNYDDIVFDSESDDSYKSLYDYNMNEENVCFLDNLKRNLLWWSHFNGSLVTNAIYPNKTMGYSVDYSYQDNKMTDKKFYHMIVASNNCPNNITSASFAGNSLTEAPYYTLELINYKLTYLSLKNNNFSPTTYIIFNKKYVTNQLTWANFPKLPSIQELDISNCRIEYIEKHIFKNLTTLQHLFISNNKIALFPSDVFSHFKRLLYMDLSFNLYFTSDSIPYNNIKGHSIPFSNFNGIFPGIQIYQQTFKALSNLVYLDLSHTKISRNSGIAFNLFGKNLKYLSLCYTGFPLVGTGVFKNTKLIGIDLSGNNYAGYRMVGDTFIGVYETLKYVFFEKSNLKKLDWVKKLKNVVILGLNNNNINNLTPDIFINLTKLEFLDLGDNHIGNWYNQVFLTNTNMKFLNLRDNNINIITSEMLRDFQGLKYLGIGENNYVCDCVLRDLLDIAAANMKQSECMDPILTTQVNVTIDISDWDDEDIDIASKAYSKLKQHIEILRQIDRKMAYSYVVDRFKPQVEASNNAMSKYHKLKTRYKIYNNYINLQSEPCALKENIFIYDKINGATLNFQLLDYDQTSYWCYNETRRLTLDEINCKARSFEEDFEETVQNLSKYIIGGICGAVLVCLLIMLIYMKRWHIRYYYISLKNAAMISYAKRGDLVNQMEYDNNSSMGYDVFVSYCQEDRDWVLEEMIPHIDDPEETSICLHERDFEVGLSILENIITCMDRSRIMLMVVSKNFLLSKWCQFEMHLAQHRMFETNKEHLILVFLEDIPKAQRPKNLQYLMDVKTYIKWPHKNSSTEEEKKLFWLRLRKALVSIP
ncbi:hypothetical protein ACFFRR_010073 [Megaselia abdita]